MFHYFILQLDGSDQLITFGIQRKIKKIKYCANYIKKGHILFED